jgi:dihydrofolate synthase/folylpolyglutamate synthase
MLYTSQRITEKLERFLAESFRYRTHEIDLSLVRIETLLKSLGNPHENLPPTIHVAGTNGKGSTIAFLRSILETSGYKVHTYISPHLVRENERIRLAGQLISDDFFENLLDQVIPHAEKAKATIFEVLTSVAFLAFSQVPADIVLLETGMGGRLDATNVLSSVLASVITSISLDHQDFLGNTLSQIAFEKAGIIKPGCPVISSLQDPSVLKILKEQAALKKSPFYEVQDLTLPSPILGLMGDHQVINAATALLTLRLIRDHFPCREAGILEGLMSAKWPGRLQQLTSGILIDNLPCPKPEVWIDGAHNEGGAISLGLFLKKLKETSPKKTIFVFNMLKTKSLSSYLPSLLPYIDEIILVPIPGRNCYSVQEIAPFIPSHIPLKSFSELDLIKILTASQNMSRIFITGSLYLVGEVLKQNQTYPN